MKHVYAVVVVSFVCLSVACWDRQPVEKGRAVPAQASAPQEPGAPTMPRPPTPKKTDGAVSIALDGAQPARKTYDVLVETRGSQGQVTLHALYFDAKGALAAGPRTRVTYPNDGSRHMFAAAHDGTRVCMATHITQNKGKETLRALTFALADPIATLSGHPLTATKPHAAFIHGSRCLIGGLRASVQQVDFSSPAPKATTLVTELQHAHAFKAIDFFVDTGETLIAVDDVAEPFYAFVFDWQKGSKGRTLSKTSRAVELVTQVGVSYQHAIETQGTVILHAAFGGWGSFESFSFYKKVVDDTPDVVLSQASKSYPENEPYPNAIFGDKEFSIQGMHALGETWFVSTGSSEILSVPLSGVFARKPDEIGSLPYEVHAFPGRKAGAMARFDGRLFVLFEREGVREVAHVKWAQGKLTLGSSVRLPKGEARFVPGFEPQ